MKHSIKSIFQGLKMYLSFVLLLSFSIMILSMEQNLSFDKVNNLSKQKKIIKSLIKLKKDDIELALIQFNGKSTQLLQNIDKLRSMYKYDYTDRFIFNNNEYLKDLDKLTKLTNKFNAAAHKFYINNKDKVSETKAEKNLKNAFIAINSHINLILLKSIQYNQRKFDIVENIAIGIFVIIIFATLWYRKKLQNIYKDLEYLYHIDKSKIDYTIYSLEADAIAMRMNRKAVVTDNPTMMDPVTSINNYKGMMSSYADKKNLKDSNFTSVTILEVDNFSKSKRTFSQEFTQAILKKIAYTISLHEQAIDVIARTDYNQFTLIFSRASKEQSFKDIDLVRQSIEELKFNIPDKGAVTITVSGGYIIKPNNTNLEEALKQAKEILIYAKSTGINKIFQTRDLAERDM